MKKDMKNSNQSAQSNKLSKVNLDQFTSNDISFYNKNSINFNASTNIPWFKTMGDRTIIKTSAMNATSTAPALAPSTLRLRGIMALDILTGPGWAASPSDPINIAMTQIMADIYSKTSSSTIPFDQVALTNLLTHTQSMAAHIAHAKRALKAKNYWADKNLYYPRALLKSLGFNYSDISINYPQYVSRLNDLIRQYNQLKCLNMFDTYKRQYSMFNNVYTDEDSELGQIVVFRPANYYSYVDTSDTLLCKAMPSFENFGAYLDLIQEMISTWFGSQNLYYINGYLQRAYKTAEWFVLSEMELSDTIEPTVDPVIMMQICNCTICNVDLTSCNVTGDPINHTVKWMPQIESTAGSIEDMDEAFYLSDDAPLKMYVEDVTNDDNMELTRLTAFATVEETGDGDIITYLYRCSPEIVTKVWTYAYDMNSEEWDDISIPSNVLKIESEEVSLERFFDTVKALSCFRWTPIVVARRNRDAFFMGDIYKYTMYDRKTYNEMQRVAALSLYHVVGVD